VGCRNAKSLAVVIPAKVARECHIGTSTIFVLKIVDGKTKHIVLETLPVSDTTTSGGHTDEERSEGNNRSNKEEGNPAGQKLPLSDLQDPVSESTT
jgi:hypothetical protein